MNAIGAIIMAVFATLWWIVGTAASGRGSLLTYATAVVISGIIIVIAQRLAGRTSGSPEEWARRGRIVGIASGVEGLMIFAAVNILANVGRRDLTAPIIAIIVGLHFVPLAYWFPARMYYVTSALLVGLGVVGMAVLDANARLYGVSVASACVLWLTCGVGLWTANRAGTEQ